jgi:transcriptional regulator with XRE-family HTH domain
METFATLIQRGRAATGLSYQRIAELVGRAPSTIRGWEWGRNEPNDPEVVMALAAVLDLPEDELLESLGLSRPTDSLGGSFSDLAPADLEPDEVVSSWVEALSANLEKVPVAEDTAPRVGEVGAVPGGAAPAGDDGGGTEATPDSPRVEPMEDEPDQESAAMSRPTPRVVHAESHRTTIPPQPLLVVPVQRSYLEDHRQMRTYRVRALLTFAVLVVLLLLVEWGLHGASHSLKEALSVGSTLDATSRWVI